MVVYMGVNVIEGRVRSGQTFRVGDEKEGRKEGRKERGVGVGVTLFITQMYIGEHKH